MISVADIQPCLLLKSTFFHQHPGFYRRYFSDKVHSILIEEVPVQTTLRDGLLTNQNADSD